MSVTLTSVIICQLWGKYMKKVFAAVLLAAAIFAGGSGVNAGNAVYAQSAKSTKSKQSVTSAVTALNVSKSKVEIKSNGYSAFVDAAAAYEIGDKVNVNSDAAWSSDNPDVASAYGGRILAEKKGKATITVAYSNFTKKIAVTVDSTVSFPINKVTGTLPGSVLSGADRSEIITSGRAMCDYRWTPTADLKGWRNGCTFKKGSVCFGVPYSKTIYQQNLGGFADALGSSDFYSSFTQGGITMPKYGNDSSGLVSFALGISRDTDRARTLRHLSLPPHETWWVPRRRPCTV